MTETAHYKLRTLQINEDVIQKVLAYTNGTYAYCTEKATRVHMHWYLQLEKSQEGLRKILRSAGLVGNSGYSLTRLEVDTENPDYPYVKYLAYLIKENADIIHTLPEDVVDKAKAYDMQVKSSITGKGEKKVWKKIIQMIIDDFKEKRPGHSLEELDLSHQEIAKYVVRYHVENQLVFRSHMCVSYVDTIWLHLQENISANTDKNTKYINLYADAIASQSTLIKYNDLKTRRI